MAVDIFRSAVRGCRLSKALRWARQRSYRRYHGRAREPSLPQPDYCWAAYRYFEDYGHDAAGWLHLSEINSCVQHMGPEQLYFGFEVEVALDVMRLLVHRLNDAHVRLVFNNG